jgi:hypothetical protein
MKLLPNYRQIKTALSGQGGVKTLRKKWLNNKIRHFRASILLLTWTFFAKDIAMPCLCNTLKFMISEVFL